MPTYIRVKDLANAATTPATDDFILLSGTANGARKISRADFLTAVAGFYTADPSTYKLATLDAGDKVLVSQLPSSAFSYKGTWAASTNTPTLANGTGTAGDTYYASDSGSVNFGAGSISFLAGDAVVYDGSVWQKVPDVVNLLDGKGTLDEAKTTLEIPDVGTAPNEVPLNGHLGSMAYQSADSVAMGTVSISDKVDGTLNVESTDGLVASFERTGNAKLKVHADSSGPYFDTENGHNLRIFTNGGEALRVNGSGLVGIGGSPSELLHLTNATAGAGVDANIRFSPTTSTTRYAEIQAVNSDGNNNIDLRFFTAPAGTPVERLRIDSQGRLGVNNTSPGTNANANADDLVVGNGGEHGITIYSGSANNGRLFFSDGTGTDSYRGIIRYDHGSNAMVFGTNSSDRWTINSTGNLVAGANLGIDFSSGSTLDAYEEGSHTTTVGVSGSGSVTMDSSFDRIGYTIIGDSVSITGLLKVDSVSSPVGALEITLPTVPANFTESGAAGGGAIAYYDASALTWSNKPFTFEEGSSTVSIKLDASTLAASDQIRLSFVYFQV